jgi:hypothetical protein
MRAWKKRLSSLAAAAALTAGISIIGTATPASATSFVCNWWGSADGTKCAHQTSLHTGNEWHGGSSFNTADEVLKLQGTDGNLVLYCKNSGYSVVLQKYLSAGQAVWASGFHDSSGINYGVKMDFWTDGNLATYIADNTTAGQPNYSYTWDTKTWHGADTWAVVQADGNFVLWEGGRAVWASNTYHVCPGTEDYWNGYQ